MTQPTCEAERHAGTDWKLPPTSLPRGTVTVVPRSSADTSCSLHGLAVDLLPDQFGQYERPLRVPDQDHAPPAIVARQVVVPGVAHVGIGQAPAEVDGAAGDALAQPRQGDLPVQRRKRAARRSEARELLGDHVAFGRVGGHVALRPGVGGDGRVDVEAVHRRLRVGCPCLPRHRPVGGHDGRGVVDGAGIVPPRPAQPRLVPGVIVRGLAAAGDAATGAGAVPWAKRGPVAGTAMARAKNRCRSIESLLRVAV